MQAKLKQDLTDTVRLKVLKQLTAAYSPLDPRQKFVYANISKHIAEKLHKEPAIADAYMTMGLSYAVRARYDSALYYFQVAYDKAEKISYALGMARCMVNMGFSYDRLDDQKEAIKYYSQALSIFKKEKFQKGIDQCNANIGSLYFDLDQYKTAQSYFIDCLKSYTARKDTIGMAGALYSVGDCDRVLGNYQKAISYYNKSLAMRKKEGNIHGQALAHRGLGIAYDELDQYDKAQAQLDTALAQIRTIKEKYEEAAILKAQAELQIDRKQYGQAEKYAREHLAIGYQIKNKTAVAQALRNLVSAFKEQHQIDKAFEYQTRYVKTEDSILAEKELQDITLLEFSRVRNENAALSKDFQDANTKNSDYKERITHYSNVIVITSIVLVCVILLLLMLYHRNLEKQATNKLLTQQKEEIANINHELETLNEEVTTQMELTNSQNAELERLNSIKNKFFSIVSHDIRGPLITLRSLFSIYRSGSITEDELRMLLVKLEETILSTSAFLDNLLEWSKSQLEGIVINPVDLNISDCIAENVELFESKAELKGLKINNLAAQPITVHADHNMIRLVLRNLLSNSIKFCNTGDEITLNAQIKEDKALISVHDNGPGISDAERAKLFSLEHIVSEGTHGEKGNHLGLILCRDMVMQNKGNIWLDPQKGEGTTFWIELPLSA